MYLIFKQKADHRIKFSILVILIFTISLLTAEDIHLVKENTNIYWGADNIVLDNGVVNVWQDTESTVWKLYAQKVDAYGNQLWNNGEPILLDDTQTVFPRQFETIKTNDNCIIIVWRRIVGNNSYIYAQKLSSSGQILWSQGNELITTTSDYPKFNLAVNETGGCYIILFNYNDDEISGINLDAEANNLWAGNPGFLISDSILEDVLADNHGGLIVNYTEQTTEELIAARIDADGNLLWNNIISSDDNFFNSELITIGDDDFIIYWRESPHLIGQRLDINGTVHWSENGIQINSQPFSLNAEAKLFEGDNSFFMTFPIESPNPFIDRAFEILKYDLDANPIWSNSTILSHEFCYLAHLTIDSDQNCLVSWLDNGSIFVQKIDVNGDKLWNDDAINIGSAIGFDIMGRSQQLNIIENDVFLTWFGYSDNTSFLRYQVLDQAGNFQLPEEGCDIKNGIYTWIDNPVLIGNDNSSYFLWEDYRFGTARIFAQRTSPEGYDHFPEFGLAITDTAYFGQYNCVAKALPEGGVIVAWNEVKENEMFSRVRWQILHPDGTVQAVNGNDITTDVNANQTDPKLDIVDGNIIIAWLENDQIKAQKLENYSPVWGSNGSLLIENGEISYFELSGNYIYFRYLDDYYFNRITDDGNLDDDWAFPGVESQLLSYEIKTMNEHNGDLVYTWCDYNEEMRSFGFQILNVNGEYTFPNNGFLIIGDTPIFHHLFHFDGSINFIHESENRNDILLERYDLQGNDLLNGTVEISNDDFSQVNATEMGDDLLVSWCRDSNEDARSFMMKTIDSNGNVHPSNVNIDDFTIYSASENYKLASINDDNATIFFHRKFSIPSKTIVISNGLVSYLINRSNVPIEENFVENPIDYLFSNYPNPFNPSTEIRFQISEKELTEIVRIEIYNVKGQKVKTLLNEEVTAGLHSVIWNGTDENQKPVSSGIYLYKLIVDGKQITSNKMLLLK